jgi:diguanylate cyclase (GGDEF)-like protein
MTEHDPIAVLEERVRRLTEENEYLAAATDDMLLLGGVAQDIVDAADDEAIFETLVQRLGSIKGFAYCAIASWLEDEMFVRHEYAHEWEGSQVGLAQRIDKSWVELLNGGFLRLPSIEGPPWHTLLGPIVDPAPISEVVVGVIRKRRQPNRLLICASDRPIEDGLAAVLHQLRAIVEARIDVIDLLEDVRTLNESLHATVSTRESELSATHSQLQHQVSERARVEQLRRHDTAHDDLTGLLNRVGLLQSLGSKMFGDGVATTPFALMLLDIDRFQLINDGLGPEVGDYVLTQLARRLSELMPPESLLARIGGDEFAVVLIGVENEDDGAREANRITRIMAHPYAVAGREVFATTSIGVVLSSDYDHAEDLVRDANSALTRARRGVASSVEFYDTEMRLNVVKRLALESSLRRAIENQELFLEYQPLVDLPTGLLSGFEALVRWNHPERGRVGPDEFIPLAEDNGLIVDIGKWVLAEACSQLAHWHGEYEDHDHITVSVNASAHQLAQSNFVEEVSAILDQTGVEGRWLHIELTESSLVGHGEGTRERMGKLRELGIDLYMDDFGTGYSSLTYLHRFPIDVIKIDRSFVMNMDERENELIVKTIIRLAQSLNKPVVAEGVETEDQLAALRRMDCEIGQGYFFSKPLSADAAGKLIATPRRW